MHGCQGPWFTLCQFFKHAASVMRVRHIIREGTCLALQQGFPASFEDAISSRRYAVTPLMKQIRAEQRSFGFFKENACIPSMWHVRGRYKSEAISPRWQYL